MPRIVRSNLAAADLADIWLFVAEDNPTAADALLDEMDRVFQTIAASPMIGRARDELARGLRSFPVRRYVIFYRVLDDGIEIARVLSGYRDVESLF